MLKIPKKCLTKYKAGSKQRLIFDWFEIEKQPKQSRKNNYTSF